MALSLPHKSSAAGDPQQHSAAAALPSLEQTHKRTAPFRCVQAPERPQPPSITPPPTSPLKTTVNPTTTCAPPRLPPDHRDVCSAKTARPPPQLSAWQSPSSGAIVMTRSGRPRVCRNGVKMIRADAKKRNRFTNKEKLGVIDFFQKDNDMNKTISHFLPSFSAAARKTMKKSIYQWRQQRAELEERCASSKTANHSYTRQAGISTTLTPAAEIEILRWINMPRPEGVPVSNPMLCAKARLGAHAHGISPFAGSGPWRRFFHRRHKLSIRAWTRQGHIIPESAKARAQEFGEEVADAMKVLGVSTVYNTDQTAVLFEYLPRTTINEKGEKMIWVRCAGYEKRRVTAMLLGSSSGEKFLPFLIMKSPLVSSADRSQENFSERHGFGEHVWKEVKKIQSETGVQIYGNAAAWWNSRLTVAFLAHNFGSRADKGGPILLLLDDFSGHWTDEVKNYATAINVHLMKVSSKFTSACQPADVAWNRPFKSHLRGLWAEDLADQVLGHSDDFTSFKLKVADRSKITRWIVES